MESGQAGFIGSGVAGLNFPQPKNLVEAYSGVQQLWLTERQTEGIEKEFVTLEHLMAFSRVGMWSVAFDGIVWLAGFVGSIIVYFLSNYYLTTMQTDILFWHLPGPPLYWMFKVVSFAGFASSTVLCIMMGRYITGAATKRAINGLWYSRFSFLVMVGFFGFAICGAIYKIVLSDEYIMHAINFLAKIKYAYGIAAYKFFFGYLKPEVYISGITFLVLAVISVILTVFSGGLFKLLNKEEKELGR